MRDGREVLTPVKRYGKLVEAQDEVRSCGGEDGGVRTREGDGNAGGGVRSGGGACDVSATGSDAAGVEPGLLGST